MIPDPYQVKGHPGSFWAKNMIFGKNASSPTDCMVRWRVLHTCTGYSQWTKVVHSFRVKGH